MIDSIEMIIFDLDGTLWEVSELTYNSANSILKKHNIDYEIPLDVINKSMGLNFEECAKNYMPVFSKEKREELMAEICNNTSMLVNKFGGNIYENVQATLQNLSKKYKIALVSNCANDDYIEAFFRTGSLAEFFYDYIAASKYKITKSQAINEVMKRNNIKNAIYVGDTVKDKEASESAGTIFVHAKYGFGKNVEAKYTINNIKELITLLEK